MNEGKLLALSLDFAADIVNFCTTSPAPATLKNQLLRSGTSIGANAHEAKYAHSRADFISKLQISLKECHESEYWLKLFLRTGFIGENQHDMLTTHCGTLRRILIASITTAKANADGTASSVSEEIICYLSDGTGE